MRLFLILFLCSISFVYAQDFSKDKKLGEEGKAEVEALMGIYNDPEKTKLLSEIGNKLVSNLDHQPFQYQFFIVDMGEPNAFALPGGYVFFTRGILALANSEDELAGVMGHEIIHSNNRHTIKQQKKAILPGLLQIPGAIAGAIGGEGAAMVFSPLSKGGQAIMASHSRKDEYEADELGIQLSAKSGYHPEALGKMLSAITETVEVFTGKKEKSSYFNDHPFTPDRVARINKGSEQLKPSTAPKIFKDQKDFMRFIDGVVVGPNPKQGVFKGDWFLHPDLNFKLKIPAQWIRQNSTMAVVSMDSTESALMMLEIESNVKSADEAAQSFAKNFQSKTGVTLTVESKKINGNPASRVIFSKNQRDGKFIVTQVWIEYGGLVFKLTGGSNTAFDKMVTENLESFSSLTAEDRKSVTKKVINVVETRPGETIKAVCDRSQNVIAPGLIAAINGVKEDNVFQQGELIKVVIEVPY